MKLWQLTWTANLDLAKGEDGIESGVVPALCSLRQLYVGVRAHTSHRSHC